MKKPSHRENKELVYPDSVQMKVEFSFLDSKFHILKTTYHTAPGLKPHSQVPLFFRSTLESNRNTIKYLHCSVVTVKEWYDAVRAHY